MVCCQADSSTLAWQQLPVRNGYLPSDQRISGFLWMLLVLILKLYVRPADDRQAF
jgi:hypothetical protein